MKDRRKLDADRAGTDDHQGFRDRRQLQKFDIAQDDFSIDLDAGHMAMISRPTDLANVINAL